MKKHELLEKAMRDYPKGTKFEQIATKEPIESCGMFKICKGYGSLYISNVTSNDLVYNSDINKWAKIIPEKPKSILDGKCAIYINNEREFKLLMEHYESKGWRWLSNESPYFDGILGRMKFPEVIRYCDKFSHQDALNWECSETTVIPFKDFAAEIGIEVPVFIMTSEDGVPLYVEDEYHRSVLDNGKWSYDISFTFSNKYVDPSKHAVIVAPHEAKAFSTKEAAEKWISEMNKPKEILLHQKSEWPAKVTKNKVWFKAPNSFDLGIHDGMNLTGQELEEIYTAYKSLQS